MEKSLRLYQQLIGEVEAAMAPLLARHRGTLRCAPGCDACCQALSLLPIEALVVHRALQTLPEEMRQQCRRPEEQAGTACPFLRDRHCAIYEARPLICRTHGLAIAYVDEEREVIEVSACPRNFADDFPFRADDLLFLDPFNARLAALNEELAQAAGIPATPRLAMAAIIALTRFPP